MGPLRIRTPAQFRTVVESGGGIVITDTARPPTFHADPIGCRGVREEYFRTKVIENKGANGAYFAVSGIEAALEHWSGLVLCKSPACSGAGREEPARTGAGSPAELLAAATRGARVRPRVDPPAGVEAIMDGWTTTQRIALGEGGSGLVLVTWPAEMKAQARAVYGTDVGGAIVTLVERSPDWTVRPSPHLAFNGARRDDRLYFHCPLDADEYVKRWSRPEALAEIRAHPADSVRSELWPWLCAQGFADRDDPAPEAALDHYMAALDRRRSDAHLRPGLTLERRLDEDEDTLRAAVAELARALGERLPAVGTGDGGRST